MTIKHYELLALVSGTLSEEETQAAQHTIRTLLEKHNARVTKQDVWERRKLAYPIKHVRQGTYLLFTFDTEPASVNALERDMTLERLVLRHQMIIAHQKTAKELETETRRARAPQERRENAEPAKPVAPISAKELDEKLAEILTDDMVK